MSKRRNGKASTAKKRTRRVLLQRPSGIGSHGSPEQIVDAELAISNDEMHAWQAARDRATPLYPIVRLTTDGVDWGVWPAEGDEIGYGMHPFRTDDCFAAAIATCTQVPIEQVPDFRLQHRWDRGEDPDEINRSSWERLHSWVESRGLRLVISEDVPMPHERWIGVAVPSRRVEPDEYPFQSHCLVMRQDAVFFDPLCSVRLPRGALGRYGFFADDVTYGIGLLKEE